MALNERQLRFVEAMLTADSAKDAAIAAGYAESNAEYYASRLLARQDVQDELERLRAERSKRTAVTADWVVQQLQVEATDRGEGASHGARVKALELLGKHVGMFKERVEVSGHVEVSDAHARLALLVDRAASRAAGEGDRGAESR